MRHVHLCKSNACETKYLTIGGVDCFMYLVPQRIEEVKGKWYRDMKPGTEKCAVK